MLQFPYPGQLPVLFLPQSTKQKPARTMAQITLSATPKGNGYQAPITYSYDVSISSAETFPTIAEAITPLAIEMLEMSERLEEIDRSEVGG